MHTEVAESPLVPSSQHPCGLRSKDLLTPWLTGHLTYLPTCLVCLCRHSHACLHTHSFCIRWHQEHMCTVTQVPHLLTCTQMGLCSCGHQRHMSPWTHGLDPVAGIQNTIPHLHIHKIGHYPWKELERTSIRTDCTDQITARQVYALENYLHTTGSFIPSLSYTSSSLSYHDPSLSPPLVFLQNIS